MFQSKLYDSFANYYFSFPVFSIQGSLLRFLSLSSYFRTSLVVVAALPMYAAYFISKVYRLFGFTLL